MGKDQTVIPRAATTQQLTALAMVTSGAGRSLLAPEHQWKGKVWSPCEAVVVLGLAAAISVVQ